MTYFPCDQWLDKDEGDGQIRRQLMATKKATDKRKGNIADSYNNEVKIEGIFFLYLITSISSDVMLQDFNG